MWQQNQTIFYSRRDITNIGFTEDDFKNVFVEKMFDLSDVYWYDDSPAF